MTVDIIPILNEALERRMYHFTMPGPWTSQARSLRVNGLGLIPFFHVCHVDGDFDYQSGDWS